MSLTPSQSNAQACRDFVPTLHTAPYPAIDPSLVKLPSPYVVCIIGGRGAAAGGLARSFARAGASGIILAARTRPALDDTANEVRSINPATKVVVAECDVTSTSSVEALASTTKATFDGHLDVVVVNSGYSGPMTADVVQESPADFQSAFEVNTIGTFHAAHHFLPLLLGTQSGAKAFIAISSMATPTVAGHTHYCVSKAAQARFVEMLYEQYAGRGLFCASVHPGGLKSEFSNKSMPKQFHHLLTDSPDLVGSFCVWLTKPGDSNRQLSALNGRFLSCKWDVCELEERFDAILEKDLLRFRVAVDL
ncbi:NAD(P)-binding protein [Aspergillus ellipticus CBS 707.79]|uniref:NAD(P)-binding protein n=1 Tax=Aspergillus ellipticus CBS 707.79 TaxID=1448320 RepID=A0A319DIH2_9EURO|nr:NAD(P)-binding protein [Aspergillus ellipticus CBS 707.79]